MRYCLYVATVISSLVSMPAFAQGVHEQGSWCLQGYQTGTEDCSFSSRNQCLVSAAGGLGGCELNVRITTQGFQKKSVASIRY